MYEYKGEVMQKDRVMVALPAGGVGERSEPEPTAGSGAADRGFAPDPEVDPRPIRRKFTTEQKQRILREADACGRGGVGALLRREGIYSSQLAQWRREQKEGFPKHKLGRKPTVGSKAKEIARLERQNRRLTEQLRKAGIIIDAQKKLCDALGLEVPPIPED